MALRVVWPIDILITFHYLVLSETPEGNILLETTGRIVDNKVSPGLHLGSTKLSEVFTLMNVTWSGRIQVLARFHAYFF